jgi:cell shape-determining protein MreD
VVFYILQTAIFSRITLIAGTADLILLFLIAWSLQEEVKNTWLWTAVAGVLISLVSAMPFFAPMIGYLGAVGLSKLLQRRVWRIPILAMFIVTLLGTLFQHIVYVIALQVDGAPISWVQSLDTIIVPSVLLNLIFALPIYAIANELVGRIYPLEVET